MAPESVETHRLRPFSIFNSATHYSRPVTMIASVGLGRELGCAGRLCWHIKEDLQRFKQLTMGGAVIMGRKTWESLPRKPLPGRFNIVVTSNPDYEAPGASRAGSIEEALALAEDAGIFIIGGESIYRQALPYATRIELTEIMEREPNADAFFPETSPAEWKTEHESETMTTDGGLSYRYITLSR